MIVQRLLPFLFVLTFFQQVAAPPAASPSATTPSAFRISGRVIDAITKQPLARAFVAINPANSPNTPIPPDSGREGARQRLLGDGVNNPAADSKRGRRGCRRRRSGRRSDLLEEGQDKKKRQQSLDDHTGYSSTFVNSRSILADCSGDSVTSRAFERYFFTASGFAYSSRSG